MVGPFKSILVPVDFTPKNDQALEVARSMAALAGAHVTLLHVVETIADEGDDDETREFIAMLQSKAEEQLGGMTLGFHDAGISVRQEIVLGRRGPEILQYSVDHEIDLVVLSSHKVDLAQPVEGLATLSHQVSMLCQCPVLLVK